MTDFATGILPQQFVDRLGQLCARGTNAMRGYHGCGFAELTTSHPYPIVAEIEGLQVNLGNREIFVSRDGNSWFAAPNLIYHYVTDHAYKPPAEFVEAVLYGNEIDVSVTEAYR